MVSYKNYEFESFGDKDFVTAAKSLIKSYNEFNKFLEVIGLEVNEFIELMVYLSPQVFTPNLVKFIQKYYLKEKPDESKNSNS